MKSYFNTVGVLHTRFCHGFCHVCIICYIHHWFYHIFYHGSILWFMATMGFVNRKFMPPSHARSGLKSSTCTGPLGNKIGPFYWNIMGESWDNGSPTSVFFLVAVCYGIGGPFSLIYLLQVLVYLEFMSHFEPLWHCGGLQFELPRVKKCDAWSMWRNETCKQPPFLKLLCPLQRETNDQSVRVSKCVSFELTTMFHGIYRDTNDGTPIPISFQYGIWVSYDSYGRRT